MQSQTVSLSPSTSLNGSGNSSPKSALTRLRRKLSPKRVEQRSLSSSSSSSSSSINSTGSNNELQRVFNYLDENRDGKISAGELQSCVRTVGGWELSSEDAENAVNSCDIDGDGVLGFEDFQKLMEGGSNSEKEELRVAFGLYETEPGSGFISPSSLKRMLSRLGDSNNSLHDCDQMIRAFDINGDGLLSFHEFSLMMMR